MPIPVRFIALALAGLAACTRPASLPREAAAQASASPDRVRALLTALAHDSMEGRQVGRPGEARAARFIAGKMRDLGLEPVGDSGFFQRLPAVMATVRSAGRGGGPPQERVVVRVLPGFADRDTVPRERWVNSINVLGMLRGSDPQLSAEVVVIGAHFDHVGIRPAVNGDSIANGADDDASGVVAMLEAARIVAAGPRPKRSILFAAFTGEEAGTLGVRWYSQHPVVPLDRHVADIQVEMIGRPDTAAGGPGKAWLTGFERSTMGPTLAAAGLPVIADPRPTQRFFERSDNIVFARLGIVAHTLSSFGLHGEYHTVDDEVELVDFAHMTIMVDMAARALQLIANGERLQWNPGGKP